MEIADGKMITALAKISPGWGGDPAKPFDEGVLIWDLKDPLNPQKLGQYKTCVYRKLKLGRSGGEVRLNLASDRRILPDLSERSCLMARLTSK
jgi:hypothetical protein